MPSMVQNAEDMIKEAIESAKFFTENNFSVDYFHLIDTQSLILEKRYGWYVNKQAQGVVNIQLMPTGNTILLKGFEKLISLTKKYIENYKAVLSSIEKRKSKRNIHFIEIINSSTREVLEQYYPFKIKELYNGNNFTKKIK